MVPISVCKMSASEQSLKVFVSRLPLAWAETDVRRYFEVHGHLTQVSVFSDEGRSLGCAYITFAKRTEAEETIRALSKSVHGTYTLSVAREPCSSDGRMGRRNAWDRCRRLLRSSMTSIPLTREMYIHLGIVRRQRDATTGTTRRTLLRGVTHIQ